MKKKLKSTSFKNTLVEKLLRKKRSWVPSKEFSKMHTYANECLEKCANIELPTRYENPLTYTLLSYCAEQIENVIKDTPFRLSNRPLIGTLPMGDINAAAIPVPSSDEYIIVFEPELFHFIYLLSKAITRAIPLKGFDKGQAMFDIEPDFGKDFNINKEALNHFQEAICAYLINGQPSAVRPYIPEEPWGTIATLLTSSMELFVLGHEYGHIINNHRLTSQTTFTALGTEKIERVEFSWQQELEADALGAGMMISVMKRNKTADVSLSYCGADLFFSYIDIVERGKSILASGYEETDTLHISHPQNKQRRGHLRKALGLSILGSSAEAPIRTAIKLEQIVENLWENTKPILFKCYKDNQKLSPIWWMPQLGQDESLIKSYDQAIQINPRNFRAWYGKFKILDKLGRRDEAFTCYEKLFTSDPQDADDWYTKGYILSGLRRLEEAISCFDLAINLDSQHANAWNDKGTALGGLGRHGEAITCFDYAIKIKPQLAKPWFNKGLALSNLGRFKEAVTCYDKALVLDPQNAQVWYSKGNSLARLGRFEEAITCYDQALTRDSKYTDAWFNKGIVLSKLRQLEMAITCYENTLKLDTKHINAWYKKGILLDELGRHEEAIVCFNNTLNLDPKHADAWADKGIALAKLKRYEESIPCYDQAIELNSQCFDAWYNKGATLAKMGQFRNALQAYEQALIINPGDEYAKRGRERLLERLLKKM